MVLPFGSDYFFVHYLLLVPCFFMLLLLLLQPSCHSVGPTTKRTQAFLSLARETLPASSYRILEVFAVSLPTLFDVFEH